MAGYSGTPLAKKLGIRDGDLVVLSREPETFRGALGASPDGVTVRTRVSVPRSATTRRPDVIVAFFTRRGEFERRLPRLMDALDVDGGLWIAWPKRASGVPTDITEDVVRDVGVPTRDGRQQGLRHRRHLVGPAVGLPGGRPPRDRGSAHAVAPLRAQALTHRRLFAERGDLA